MESIGQDLREMLRVPLAPSHVDALREVGKIVEYAAGTVIVQPGEAILEVIHRMDGAQRKKAEEILHHHEHLAASRSASKAASA